MVDRADRMKAALIGHQARDAGAELGVELPPPPEPEAEAPAAPVVPHGERLVTSLFADVRGYSELSSSLAPDVLTDRIRMFYRLARVAVERRQGMIDKFAGDAVMATFNHRGTAPITLPKPWRRRSPFATGRVHRAAPRHRNRRRAGDPREGYLRREHRGHR